MEIHFENIICQSCGKSDFKPLYKIKDNLTQYESFFELVQCQSCDLVFINPRPIQQELGYFYPKEFLSYQMEKVPSGRFDFKRKLVNFVSTKVAKQRVSIVNKHKQIKDDMSILDFGSGAGEFLNQIQTRYKCQVLGVDFNPEQVKNCQDKGIRSLTIEEFEKQDLKFDIITLWHVLEHVGTPKSLLSFLNTKLNDGGVIFIEVPNWQSLENKLFRENSYLLDPPRHLFQFSKKTIMSLLHQSGYEIESVGYVMGEGGWMGSFQNGLFQGKPFKDFYKNIYLVLLISLLIFPIDLISNLIHQGSILKIVAKKRISDELRS